MKKTLLFFLTTFSFVVTTLAQTPTLTAGNSTPVLGELFLNQTAAAANVSFYSSGANQTWDYNGLTDSSASTTLQVVAPASTPYASSFPTSNLAIQTANNANFVYFNSQTSKLSILGLVSKDTGTVQYTTSKIYLPYPFSYGSFYTDSVVAQLQQYNVVARGKDSLSGDGYGMLMLPGGKSYNHVLRVKYIENLTTTRDTTVTAAGLQIAGQITLNLRTISYLYYTPDTHNPLLTVAQTTVHITVAPVAIPIPVFDSSSASNTVTYLKSSSTLPVTFTSFTASLQNKNVLLQWKTAQETNTHHFNIQRSLTGTDFSTVDAVAATANGTGSTYIYNDQTYAKTNMPPSVYYRIQEVDKDGKLFYSGTALVHGTQNITSLYPNPAGSFIRFSIPNATVADAVVIYDAKGRAVKQWSHYTLTQPAAIDGLSKGTYFIQIKVANKTTTTTFVKE